MAAVRVALEENLSGGGLIRDNDLDTLTLDQEIWSKVEDAAVAVSLAAPKEYFREGERIPAGAIEISWDMSGRLPLPADFMRLLVFQMDEWQRPVYEPIGEDDPLYSRQKDRWAGLRGTPERPVAAVVHDDEGLTLEFWSCGSLQARPLRSSYAKFPKVTGNTLTMEPLLYRPMIYMAAALTRQAYGEVQHAKELEATAYRLMAPLPNATTARRAQRKEKQ